MPDEPRKLLWRADELKAQDRAVTQRLNPNRISCGLDCPVSPG